MTDRPDPDTLRIAMIWFLWHACTFVPEQASPPPPTSPPVTTCPGRWVWWQSDHLPECQPFPLGAAVSVLWEAGDQRGKLADAKVVSRTSGGFCLDTDFADVPGRSVLLVTRPAPGAPEQCGDLLTVNRPLGDPVARRVGRSGTVMPALEAAFA